jgi:hypothetical protein
MAESEIAQENQWLTEGTSVFLRDSHFYPDIYDRLINSLIHFFVAQQKILLYQGLDGEGGSAFQ